MIAVPAYQEYFHDEAKGTLLTAVEGYALKEARETLAGLLEQEVTDREAADAALGNAVGQEAAARAQGDAALAAAIAQEASDRDTAIGEAVAQEVTDRNAAIADEASRAEAKEGELEAAIAAEETRAKGVESGLVTEIADETARAKGVEGAVPAGENLYGLITQETDERESAITAEAAARDEADTALADLIAQEASDRDAAIGDAVAQEVADRDAAIGEAVAQEVTDRDAAIAQAVADAELGGQTWLPAVETKAGLPDPATLTPDTNYLCRVINDTATPANNGVWQLIAGAEDWSYFSDNLDFVDEAELAEALKSKPDKEFANATSNYVVGDFTYTPTDNKTVHLKKTAVSVDGAGTTQVYEGDLKLGKNLKLEQKTAEEFELNIDDEISDRDAAIAQAVAAEASDRDAAIGEAVAQEVADRDAAIAQAVADAELGGQTWLPAVETKAGLPDPATLASDTNYLCRVINDTATPANNGVWQLIAGAEDWSYFSDNLDFVDEAELEAAITQEAADRNAALNAKLDKKTASGEYVYIHNGATQNEKAYTIAPTPSTIAERTSAGTLRGAAATDEADLVNYAQLQNSLKTTLADEAASDALPAATPSAFAGLLQKIRDNLKFLFGGLTLKVDKITGKGLSANDYTDDEKADAADILVRPTSLQTTDPPTYHVVRIDVTAGGAGYEAGDAVTASDPPVEAAVGAVDSDGAVTALSFNGQAVYDGNPAGADIAVSGGTGSGAVFSIRTAYAPGGVQKDGVLRHVPYGDPLVQTTRMKGYVKDYLESSSTARYAVQSEAMRRWTDSYLYSAGDITNFEGVWYTPKTDNMPIYGESPATHPEKWDKSPGGGLDDEAAFQIIKLQNKIDMLMREVFGDAGVQFKDHFDLDFYTLEGVSLETGVWNDAQGRVEV